jgi:hypothetical protein
VAIRQIRADAGIADEGAALALGVVPAKGKGRP